MKTLQTFVKAPILLMLVLSLVLSGCAAVSLPQGTDSLVKYAVYSVGPGSVSYGISQAMADKVGTYILTDPTKTKYFFIWCQEGIGMAMFALDTEGKSAMDVAKILGRGGQITNSETVVTLKNWMIQNGWKIISGAELTAAMKISLTAAIDMITSPMIALYMVVPMNWDGSSLPFQLVPQDVEDTQS